MACDFSFHHYNELMMKINEKKYKSIFFHEEDSGKVILIRHDVDQDLKSSLELGKIEKKNGLKSTFFLWINSPFYNIFEVENRTIIKNLIEMGHEIGLHFDETAYDISSVSDINKYILKECDIINNYFDINIKTVSFHRPSKAVLDGDVQLDGLVNTYSDKYFNKFKYISDSRGIWREGCLCNLLDNQNYNKIQVLMHPIWWGNVHMENNDRIIKYIDNKVKKLEMNLCDNINIYKNNDLSIYR